MAENGVLFRTAMGGFNKADVMAYLDKQNADFKDFTARQNEAIASKDAEIDQLRAEIESLKKNISGLSDRLAEAEENAGLLDAAEEHAAELEARLEEANGQIFALQSKIADQTVQIAEKEGMIARLSENDPATSSEKDRKAGLYDDMSSQIGDLLIAANKSADDIVSEAKTKAGKINEDAIRNAENMKQTFLSKLSRIAESAKNNTLTATDNFRGEVKAELEEIRALLSDAIDSVDLYGNSISEKADNFEKRVSSELDSTAAEINREIEALRAEK